MQTQLEKIADRELEKMRKECTVNGEFKRDKIDAYSDRIRRYHFMGLNVLKHSFFVSELYKNLSRQEREIKDNPKYENFGVSI